MTCLRLLAVTTWFLAVPHASAVELMWHDDFVTPSRYEVFGPRNWTLAEGVCAFRAGAGDSRLVALLPHLDRATFETELTFERRTGAAWTYAGLALFADPLNHWQLMLVEGPDGRRYPELIEKLNGEHQAQQGSKSLRTRLEARDAGALRSWDYARRYRLTLTISPEEISGRITDTDSGEFWQRTFSFARGIAVKQGRPSLIANGMAGEFHFLRAEAQAPDARDLLPVRAGEAGAVAILRDEGDRVAPALARAFERAGYGVTLVDWAQIGTARLPHDALDLLVIADARRLPVGARDALVAALHVEGKVIAVGAPALAELLVQTPEGWRGPRDWQRVYAGLLDRTPVDIPPDAWRRASSDLTRPSSLTPDPESGERAWMIAADMTGGGWDTYTARVDEPFGPDSDLLVFEARGDDNTRALMVECTEQDGSRWIATVDLSPDWEAHVLRPADFTYWHDSPAVGRGGAGDRLQPRSVNAIVFGLATSHIPDLGPGLHTCRLRNLATAARVDMPDPDFSVPDIEALCPSYKLYPLDQVARLQPAPDQLIVPGAQAVAWPERGYSPVWRERGRGLNRGRSWRWVPVISTLDPTGRERGALVSLMIGDGVSPGALWANVGVADPADALDERLLPAIIATAGAMTRGLFLLEGGAEFFSYPAGEAVVVGARAANSTREDASPALRVTVADAGGALVFERSREVRIAPGRDAQAQWEWRPETFSPEGYTVTAELIGPEGPLDRISHRIEALRTEPARPEELVRVEGSNFMLGERPWFFKGINYRPSWVGGYPHLNLMSRECYDPEMVERDFAWMRSVGMNAISAVHSLMPPDPDAAGAFRDLHDFLDRCERHGLKVYFTVPYGRPYQGADVGRMIAYLEKAGLRDHPAIMCWELAWEPIETPWRGRMDFMLDDWNRWIVERYGSVDNAMRDWEFEPERTEAGLVAIPTADMCLQAGPWGRHVAAFRRAFSDIISAHYRDIVMPLREWDPHRLISFRGGACGIPEGTRFAHTHSVGVARHMDFLNPEGYNLQTGGWAKPTPPDDIRRGGLVTLYYRFISREKPVVWMEFGFTVNGFHQVWSPELVHIKPERLELQRAEHEAFYAMIIESGSRGAAPWWLPGGFRLGENSDFGVMEPDGAERPVCEVLRRYQPLFDTVEHRPPTRVIHMDLDAHYADAWQRYSTEYLEAVQAGEVVHLTTAGTGTNSATCPLTAVGGTEYNGRNPPQFLNAEFNRLEVRVGDGDWREVRGGETLEVPPGVAVQGRASVGNLGEAAWLAPQGEDDAGRVFLVGRREYGLEFRAPIIADTPFLDDAHVAPFTLIPPGGPDRPTGNFSVSFEMAAAGRAFFGERRTMTLQIAP